MASKIGCYMLNYCSVIDLVDINLLTKLSECFATDALIFTSLRNYFYGSRLYYKLLNFNAHAIVYYDCIKVKATSLLHAWICFPKSSCESCSMHHCEFENHKLSQSFLQASSVKVSVCTSTNRPTTDQQHKTVYKNRSAIAIETL